ncbi:hypothetical protein DYB26_008317 [Aphanomyces astaci]|uniref:Secreted protein n=2 Tax=Aphanomyces astaci TaxID=112090 RepID=A0A397EU82_APHAT|nr:hypothetical protein DYB26_008317 [Aphanomyces astaci]RHZ04428.1 hypothetical protein DYB31_010051 [Aphanomyces astaci]
MKSFVAFGVIGAVSAAPCDISAVLGNLAPLAADPNVATCSTDSGYNFLVSGASGTPPTPEELAKLSSSTACKTLYANLGGIVSMISPSCTLGGVETSTFATLSLPDALTAIFTAIKSSDVIAPTDNTSTPAPSTDNTATPPPEPSTDNASTTTPAPSTDNTSTTTPAPSSGNASTTTPAPSTAPESSAAISAVSLAAVGLAMYSMAN